MGSVYDGIPGNVAFPASTAIVSSTNASPISITANAHGLLTGDQATVSGHAVNGNANGVWTITRTGANTLTLNGSTGTAVGGATGKIQALTYGAAATIPSDGDNDSAAVFNAAYVPLFDRSAVVLPQIGFAKLSGRALFVQTNLTGTSWASYTGTLANATATAMTLGALTAFGVGAFANSSIAALSAAGPYTVTGVRGSGVQHISLRTSYSQSTAISTYILLYYANTIPGAGAPAFGSYAQVSMASCPTGNPASAIPAQLNMDGWISVASGTLWLQPVIYAPVGGVVTASLINDTILSVEQWDPTGVPQ